MPVLHFGACAIKTKALKKAFFTKTDLYNIIIHLVSYGSDGGPTQLIRSFLSTTGSTNRVSRVDEVAECQKILQRGNERTAMLPFLIHSFEEVRQDNIHQIFKYEGLCRQHI